MCNKLEIDKLGGKQLFSALYPSQYLSSIFKQNIGIGFCEYLSDIRLRYATTLLTEKQNNITEICEACGYKNISHFIRSFKKKYGTSPSRYID